MLFPFELRALGDELSLFYPLSGWENLEGWQFRLPTPVSYRKAAQ
jgi:hypothetical protein